MTELHPACKHLFAFDTYNKYSKNGGWEWMEGRREKKKDEGGKKRDGESGVKKSWQLQIHYRWRSGEDGGRE